MSTTEKQKVYERSAFFVKMVQKGKGFNLSAKFLLRLCWVNFPPVPPPRGLGHQRCFERKYESNSFSPSPPLQWKRPVFFLLEEVASYSVDLLSHTELLLNVTRIFFFNLLTLAQSLKVILDHWTGYSKSKGDWELLQSAPLWPEIG